MANNPVTLQYLTETKYHAIRYKDPDTLYYLTNGKVYHGTDLLTHIKFYRDSSLFPKIGDPEFIYIDRTSRLVYFYYQNQYIPIKGANDGEGGVGSGGEWQGNTTGPVYWIDISDEDYANLLIKDPQALYHLSSGIMYKGSRLLSGVQEVNTLPTIGKPGVLYSILNTGDLCLWDDKLIRWVKLSDTINRQIEDALRNIKFINGNF